MLKRISWRVVPLVIFFTVAFFLWRGLNLDPHTLTSPIVGKRLPDFSLPALMPQQPPFSSISWRGKMVLLNVWASWCPACSEEQVFLMQLAREGVLIYGLNYKDNPQRARTWLGEWGNPYLNIGVDPSGSSAMALGVSGTPETFLIDSQGVLLYRHAGPMNSFVWQTEFLPKILQAQHKK